MKKTIVIIVCLVGWVLGCILVSCMFSSCHTVKRSQSVATKVVKMDSTTEKRSTAVTKGDSTNSFKQVKDTAIGVPGTHVAVTIGDDDDAVVKVGGATLTTYKDKNGKRYIDCKTDSLTLVVSNMTYERDFFKHGFDSIAEIASFNTHDQDSTAVTLKEVVEKENKNIGQRVYEFLKGAFALFGLGWVMIFLAGHVIKKFTNNSKIG